MTCNSLPVHVAGAATNAAGVLVAESAFLAAVAVRWTRGFGDGHLRLPTSSSELGVGSAPVLLLHGLGANKSYFTALEKHLCSRGHVVASLNYRWHATDLSECVGDVAARLRAAVDALDAPRVHVIGHSLGGLLARAALAGDPDLAARVGVLVTLGSPHGGSPVASWFPRRVPGLGRLVGDLRPRVPATVTGGRGPVGVRQVAIAGDLDVIVPARFARLPDRGLVRNVLVRGCGHLAMPAHPFVLSVLDEELAHSRTPARAA